MTGRARLAIDYTPAPGHAPGLGRYVRELVRALARLEGGPILRLAEFGRAATPMEGAPLGLEGPGLHAAVERRRLRLPRRALARLGAFGDPVGRRAFGGSGLVHRTTLEMHGPVERDGRLRVPHTIAVAEFPAAGSPADRALAARCRGAEAVVVFSRDAADRVAARYGVPEARVRQVPVGCDHWVRDAGHTPAAPRASRDVLVLGAVRTSRRPLEALRAFEALLSGDEHARLLWVGRPGDLASEFREALRRSPARDHVRWIESPEERRMPGCVAGATALLHLADDEATPVTPLEALRAGLPVVSTPIPAYEEALGAHVRTVDAEDHGGLAAALGAALAERDDPVAFERRVSHAAPFTWRACAHAHRALWDPMLTVTGRR